MAMLNHLSFVKALCMGQIRPEEHISMILWRPKAAAGPGRAGLGAGCLQIVCPSKVCSRLCYLSCSCMSPVFISIRMRSNFWSCFASPVQRAGICFESPFCFPVNEITGNFFLFAWEIRSLKCLWTHTLYMMHMGIQHPTHYLNENIQVLRSQCLLLVPIVLSFYTSCGLSPSNLTKDLESNSSVSAWANSNGKNLTPYYKLRCLSIFIWTAVRGNATLPLLLDHD